MMPTDANVSQDDRYENILILKQSYIEDVMLKCEMLSNSLTHKYAINDKIKFLQELCRVIHSMKGTAAMYDFCMISAICHRFEDFLVGKNIAENMDNEKTIGRILQYIDLINLSALIERHDL